MNTEEIDEPQLGRKSSRVRKRKKTYSPEPESEDKQKKKKVRKTQANRPYDVLPNGEPFSCTLCKSFYVTNVKGNGKKLKSRHTPLPKIRIDERTGKEMQLCNACALYFDRPKQRVKKKETVVTDEEQEVYVNEARQFTKSLRMHLDSPYVERLYCPSSKKKLCGCLQRYIRCELQLDGVTCLERFVKLMKEAEDLRKEKVYDNHTVDNKSKYKRCIGLGNGHKKSKKYEEFVINTRRILKDDMRLCERATQRILMYSNNFLHKKLKTEERPCRLERTRGKAALGKLPEIHTLVDLTCCSENCVMMALTHKKLLQTWRERAKQGQIETRRVLAEMLTPAGANHRNCYHFIEYVTGCSTSTIGRVYNMLLENSGNPEPPEHGMKKVWQENYRNNKVTNQSGDKEMTDVVERGTNKTGVVTEPRINQKTTKSYSQNIITTSDSNIQFELQKQQLEQIQKDLLEKQRQLEKQQANLRLQLMAQQSLAPSDQTQNQAIFQQILQQIAQQQNQPASLTQTDQGKIIVDQSSLQSGLSDNQSNLNTPALPVFNLNVVNGQLQLNYAGLNQQMEQNLVSVPGPVEQNMVSLPGSMEQNVVSIPGPVEQNRSVLETVNFVNSSDGQTTLQAGVNNPMPANITPQNVTQVFEQHLAEPASTIPQETNTLVNVNGIYYNVGVPLNNLSQNETTISVSNNNMPPPYVETGVLNIAFEQPAQGSNVYLAPVNVNNVTEENASTGFNTHSQTNGQYMLSLPVAQDNVNAQGQLNVNNIPVQVVDTNGQQCYILQNDVNEITNKELVQQSQVENQMVNITMEAGQMQNSYNSQTTSNDDDKNMGANTGSGNQQALPNIQTVQFTMNDQSQDQVIINQSQHEDKNQSNIAKPAGDSVNLCQSSENGHPGKKNVQFKITKVQSTSPENVFEVTDFSNMDKMVNSDALSKKRGTSLAKQPSGSSNDSGSSTGNSAKSRNVGGNNSTNNEAFKQLTHTFKLKDLDSSVKTNNRAKITDKSGLTNIDRPRQPSGDKAVKISGDRSRQTSGNKPGHLSGNRSHHASGDKSQHISADRARKASGERSRQISGEKLWQPSGERSRQTSGDRSRQPSGNSIFSEFSSLTTISPNLFLDKDKNIFFLQTFDPINGTIDDLQSPDFSMFSSSPINIVGSNLTEMTPHETNLISSSHPFELDKMGLIKDQSASNAFVGVNQVPSTEPRGQKSIKNPVLNSILSRPPQYN